MNTTSIVSEELGGTGGRPSGTGTSRHDSDFLTDPALFGDGQPWQWTEELPTTPLQQPILRSPLDQLLQQATLLAKQLQRERADLVGSGRADGRPEVKALQQQIVEVWNAIRAARSTGKPGHEMVARRAKWD